MIYNNRTYIYCNFTKKKIEELGGSNTNLSLVYNVKCVQKKELITSVLKSDTKKYPIFIIKKNVFL